ncbi:MAG: BlaI/MecI/CopY family transcriptional regulator [Planctomycetaceae bacterium]|jgi:predicted transcriptional regulator|nr:BlaI/MecI/CopY family transcriptional regulator [Planctomycetaceae bacterium]
MTRLETLAPRERQVMEAVYRFDEASVNDVLGTIADPPTYSTVRAIMNTLTEKGYLKFRQEKGRYLYRPVVPKNKTQENLVRNMVNTIFAGNITEVVAAVLDVAGNDLSESDYVRLRKLINDSRKRRQ